MAKIFSVFCSPSKTNIALEATLQNNFYLGEMQKAADILILGKG